MMLNKNLTNIEKLDLAIESNFEVTFKLNELINKYEKNLINISDLVVITDHFETRYFNIDAVKDDYEFRKKNSVFLNKKRQLYQKRLIAQEQLEKIQKKNKPKKV